MDEPSPHGDSPSVGIEPRQNECGSIPSSEETYSELLLVEASEINQSGSTQYDIPRSLNSILNSNYFPINEILENDDSANSNGTDNFDSDVSCVESATVVNHQRYSNNADTVDTVNQTRNTSLPSISPKGESFLPSPFEDTIAEDDMVKTWEVGSNPVDWAMFKDEMETEEYGMPLSPDTTIEVISESNKLGSTSENTSVLSEDIVRELLSLLAEFNERSQVGNLALDTGSDLLGTFHLSNQPSRSAGIGNSIDVPVTTQKINQSDHSAVYLQTLQTSQLNQLAIYQDTTVAGTCTSQQANQFNQFAVYPGTAIKDTSQRTIQSSQIATGLTASMPVTSHQADQPEMYHSTSVSDASTAVTSTSCQSSQSSPSLMNSNINQSNEFNLPIIDAGITSPCTSFPYNQLGLPSVCVPGQEGVSAMNMVIVYMANPLPTQALFDRSPMNTNWNSLGACQDQASSLCNQSSLDEEERLRKEKRRIRSKKNRDKTKEQNKALEAKKRELSEENVKLKEDVERLKKEKEELKVKLGSKKD